MTLPEILLTILLGPLELLFDAIYATAYVFSKSPGVSIVLLSLAVNLLAMPLYRRADAIQQEERRMAEKMKDGIRHIRKTFRGDERFMILQSFYWRYHYKPYYSLRGTLPILLEVPFFLAAYRFLSGLTLLQGCTFGPIRDMSLPDGLILIGSQSFNLLPVLMTAVNILSGMLYTKGMPLKSKIQLYGMAVVFLFLLYDSPAGLVFYWTLNNLFSLARNLFDSLRCPKKVLGWLCSFVGVFLAAFFLFFRPQEGLSRRVLAVGLFAALQLPLFLQIVRKRNPKVMATTESPVDGKLFLICCILMALLCGLLIPVAVIDSSPAEFVDLHNYRNPLRYLVSPAALAVGTFLVWFMVYFGLASPTVRRRMSLAAACVSVLSVTDYFFFGTDYGNMSALLQFDELISPTNEAVLLNLAVLAAGLGLTALVWKKKPVLLRILVASVCVAVAGLSVSDMISVNTEARNLKMQSEKGINSGLNIPLDRSGKNVIVLMLDRAISSYVPFFLEEKPELKRQFKGFTYYPNTLSYGAYTNVGSPPLYGGYDYIPERMNARTDVLLKDKHNEALKVMPLNFLKKGFEVTVCDASYANYRTTPDLSIYDDWPEIHQYNASGIFTEKTDLEKVMMERLLARNLFCYSIFRASPVLLHSRLYNLGLYNESNLLKPGASDWDFSSLFQTVSGLSSAYGRSRSFLDEYNVLENLSGVTDIQDTGKGTFLMMANNTTHEQQLLQEPEYIPQEHVDNKAYDGEHRIRYSPDGDALEITDEIQMIHYHTNMAALLQLGRWFDYLRENSLYDNTRIILVSDHGRDLGLFGRKIAGIKQDYADTMFYNALLMIKDFDSREWKTDDSFMTNADTPLLAMANLVPDPENPSLHTPLTDETKLREEQRVLYTPWQIGVNDGTAFQGTDKWKNIWLTMKGKDIFDISAWSVDP